MKPKVFTSLAEMAQELQLEPSLPHLSRKDKKKLYKQKSIESKQEDRKLTPEQLANWRKVAPAIFGITGDHLSDEDIHKVRDGLEKNLNKPIDDDEYQAQLRNG